RPNYGEENRRESDDEIRRVIEEGHQLAVAVLKQHMDDLNRLSAILIERETIDKDQFERLLAGETEEQVFPEELPEAPAEPPAAEPKLRPQPKPRPLPFPGSTSAGKRRRRLASRSAVPSSRPALPISR